MPSFQIQIECKTPKCLIFSQLRCESIKMKMSPKTVFDINAIKCILHLCMRYSTGQQKCDKCGWSDHPDDFRVDSPLVRWPLASCTRATPLKKSTLHCQEDCCTQPWGSGTDGALTKGFSDLTIVGMDPSKTKYAPYCPDIRSFSVPGKMYV